MAPISVSLVLTPAYTDRPRIRGSNASRSLPVYAQVFVGIQCAYPRGMARLSRSAWVAGYISRWFAHLQTVIHSRIELVLVNKDK